METTKEKDKELKDPNKIIKKDEKEVNKEKEEVKEKEKKEEKEKEMKKYKVEKKKENIQRLKIYDLFQDYGIKTRISILVTFITI